MIIGAGHYVTMQTHRALASNLASQGKAAKAEAAFLEAIAVQRRCLGPEHPLPRGMERLLEVLRSGQMDDSGEAGALFES